MRRLQILIEEDLDEALARQAQREGVSKGSLVRRFVRRGVEPLPPPDDHPLIGMTGIDVDAEPGDVDEVVYGAP